MNKTSIYALSLLGLLGFGVYTAFAEDKARDSASVVFSGDPELVEGIKASQARAAAADKKAEARAQKADQLGLGELERMAISPSRVDPEKVRMFRGADTSQLFMLLNDRDFAGYWKDIALTIGMVADEDSAKKLAEFASTGFDANDSKLGRQIEAREGAIWGLVHAMSTKPMPWAREFVIEHGSKAKWVENFGKENIKPGVARKLAFNTWDVLARVGTDESLAMLREIQERELGASEVSAQSKDESSDSETIGKLIEVAKHNIANK